MPVDLFHVYLRDRMRVDCAWSYDVALTFFARVCQDTPSLSSSPPPPGHNLNKQSFFEVAIMN